MYSLFQFFLLYSAIHSLSEFLQQLQRQGQQIRYSIQNGTARNQTAEYYGTQCQNKNFQ